MPFLWMRRLKLLLLRDGRPGLPGFAPSKSRRRKKRRSASRRRGGSCRSRTADRSRRSSRSSSSSRGASRWRDRSSFLLTVRLNQYRRHRKSPGTRKRVCQFRV
jgi:hypothetical protein